MTDDKQAASGIGPDMSRRRLLAAGASAATTLTGFAAVTGTAAAWTRLDAEFDGCDEVRIIVSERDVAFEDTKGPRFSGENAAPPLVVDVVLTDGQDAYSTAVAVTPESTTTIPGRHGGRPVVRYRASADEKILGIIGNSPSREPLETATVHNPNRCARTPGTPSIEDAERYQNRK